jgi:DNA-binding NarL/FixJ family response regulator
MSTAPRPVRCIVVDENASYRTAAQALLTAGGLDVVCTARTGDAALRAALSARPDVVVLAAELAEEDGFEVAAGLARLASAPVVVVVTTRDPDLYREHAQDVPVAACLAKDRLSTQAVVAALRQQRGSGRRGSERNPGNERGAGSPWAGHVEAAS